MTLRLKDYDFFDIAILCTLLFLSIWMIVYTASWVNRWDKAEIVWDCRDLLGSKDKVEDSLLTKCQQIVDKHDAEYDIRKKKERLEFIERLRNEVR